MALTVVKYSKTSNGARITEGANHAIVIRKKPLIEGQYIIKKPIKLESGGITNSVLLNKIPAVIKPANVATIKRVNTAALETATKLSKFSIQTAPTNATTGTSKANNFHWQHQTSASANNKTSGNSSSTTTTTTAIAIKKEQLGQALNSLPPNTIIQAKTISSKSTENLYKTVTANPSTNFVQKLAGGTTIKSVTDSTANTLSALSSQGTTVQIRKPAPAFVIKRQGRSIKSITLDLIEKNPETHLGLSANRLVVLRNVICPTTGVSLTDSYLVLKKLRLNEDFSLLAEYFEMTVEEVHHAFTKGLVQLARYLKFLIKWSDKNYVERHKDIPIAYRAKISNVQSLVECVETEIEQPECSQYECKSYKFILSISTNDIINYVSEVYLGHYDDLTIFKSSNFKDHIPKHLTLLCDPAKGIRQKKKLKKKKASQSRNQRNKTSNSSSPSASSILRPTKDAARKEGGGDSTTDSAEESTDEASSEQQENPKAANNPHETLNSQPSGPSSILTEPPTKADLVLAHKSNATLEIVKNHIKSTAVPSISIPTTSVTEPVCREQISNVIDRLRQFKILQNYGIHEPMLYQYLSEIVVVIAALFNLQR